MIHLSGSEVRFHFSPNVSWLGHWLGKFSARICIISVSAAASRFLQMGTSHTGEKQMGSQLK
jgi:hypothetical protein